MTISPDAFSGPTMNYRHIYHAGNFADVLKHAVLTRLVEYMKRKDGGFRVLDTHAGTGRYDLSSIEAQKTGEWRDGIGRLLAAKLPDDVAALLEPYLAVVRALNPDSSPNEGITVYPGSPLLARQLLRKQDRLSAIELHEQDVLALKALFAGDFQTRVTHLDGWLALGGHLPPKEKRGIVLIDPPFEKTDEFDTIVAGLSRAAKRFAAGTYCVWYPVKDAKAVGDFHRAVKETGLRNILCCELRVAPNEEGAGLVSSGLLIVNPPYTLAGELETLLPVLTRVLGRDASASHSLFELVGE